MISDAEILSILLDRAERVCQEYELAGPEDDWPTMAILGRRDQPDFGLQFYEINFANQEEKDQVFHHQLPTTIFETGAEIMLLILPSWTIAPGATDLDTPPSQHPNRQEILFLSAYTRTSAEARLAEVTRFPTDRPELSGWRRVERKSGDQITGELLPTCLAALKL